MAHVDQTICTVSEKPTMWAHYSTIVQVYGLYYLYVHTTCSSCYQLKCNTERIKIKKTSKIYSKSFSPLFLLLTYELIPTCSGSSNHRIHEESECVFLVANMAKSALG